MLCHAAISLEAPAGTTPRAPNIYAYRRPRHGTNAVVDDDAPQ